MHAENDKKKLIIDDNMVMSNDVMSQILAGLEMFESEMGFREKRITQGRLATHLQTNTRYLSIVIKKYKAENFSLYINQLRINYVLERLEKNPEYRKYKISYLADNAGYTTATSFTRAFKDIKGMPPSHYINLFNENID